ncbi:hypothetical protein D1007_25080 [Hordeum vulgare]|nr:hypothetical protein D1007_25080 [Hordeum vulgare]
MEQSQDGGGVKVKFIETQFVSSDAANFKSVVQRLTGKYSKMPPPPSVHRPRPRPCNRADKQRRPCVSGSDQLTAAAPAKPTGVAFEPMRVEELNGLCDFADLLYATPSARRHGGSVVNGFPY